MYKYTCYAQNQNLYNKPLNLQFPGETPQLKMSTATVTVTSVQRRTDSLSLHSF